MPGIVSRDCFFKVLVFVIQVTILYSWHLLHNQMTVLKFGSCFLVEIAPHWQVGLASAASLEPHHICKCNLDLRKQFGSWWIAIFLC